MAKYFVTGGSGFIGSAVVPQLLEKGHKVLALAKSDASADKLKALGAEVIRGSLEDLGALKEGAQTTDGVIHLAFIHDFANFAHATEVDLNAIKTIGGVLEGTGKPFVGTAGTLSLLHPVGTPPVDETYDDFAELLKTPLGTRIRNESYLLGLKDKGIRSTVVRLSPTVHAKDAAGFAIIYLINSLNIKEAIYVGDGSNAWTSVQRDDAAALFILAAEKGKAGQVYHGIGEVSVKIRDLAETVSKKYGIPTKSVDDTSAAIAKIGFLGGVIGKNATATSDFTQKELGWKPKGVGLLEDLKINDYKVSFSEHGYNQ